MSLAAALAAVLLAAYVLVGALDLGVGTLLLLVARGRDRDAILAINGRPWLTGAVGALVTFALLVAGLPDTLASLGALWPALLLMLLSLALRGALAALRPHVLRQDLADLGFGLASLAAAGCQGLILGWALAGLSDDLPARHAGPLGTLSIWGLLGTAGAVGLQALIGSAWLVWSGRDAVQVFGREVGRAAAILFGGAALLGALWAIPTGVAARAFAGGWGAGSCAALFAAASLAFLAPFCLSLWGERPTAPLICAALTAACSFVAVAALASVGAGTTPGSASIAAYLCFVLLLGAPVVAADALGRRRALGAAEAAPAPAGSQPSHVGRRSGSTANSLHLS